MHRFPFDLHVLSTPPAFILSQDQTLRIFAASTFTSLLRPERNCMTTLLRKATSNSIIDSLPNPNPSASSAHTPKPGSCLLKLAGLRLSCHSSVVNVPQPCYLTTSPPHLTNPDPANSLLYVSCTTHDTQPDLLSTTMRANPAPFWRQDIQPTPSLFCCQIRFSPISGTVMRPDHPCKTSTTVPADGATRTTETDGLSGCTPDWGNYPCERSSCYDNWQSPQKRKNLRNCRYV